MNVLLIVMVAAAAVLALEQRALAAGPADKEPLIERAVRAQAHIRTNCCAHHFGHGKQVSRVKDLWSLARPGRGRPF